MATLAGESSPSPTLSGTGSMDEPSHSVNIPKRPRETCDDDDGQWDLTDDGRPKTRRVNPQRLAIRLGPDLVAEMEALIVPGAKMPTFTVRKDFQERYNVDRRHIYDYFHSRGLRVAKEDKHTNLIRGRAMKAQALAQAQAQLAQMQALSQTPSSPMVKQEAPPGGETLLPRPFLAEAVTSPAKPPGRVIKRTLKAQDKKPRVQAGRRPGRLPKALKAAREKSDLLTMLPSSSDTPESSVPTMGSSGTDTEWESTATVLVYPKFAPSDEASGIKIKRDSGDVSGFLTSPDDFVAGYIDSSSDDTQPSFLDMECNLTCDSLDLDSLMTVDEHRLLTTEERNELYDLIDSNIPRATSFEESTLAYNDYMNGHLLPYFDTIPSNYHTSTRSTWKSAGLTSSYPSPDVDCPISVDIPDLRKWLSDDLEMQHLSVYSLPFDEMEENHGLTEIIAREPLAAMLGQAQNKTVSGKALRPVDQTNKQVGYMRVALMSATEKGLAQTLQHQDENLNPCGT